MGAGIVGTLALIYLGFTALFVAAAVSIVRKAGYSGWWVAAGAVPLVNVVMLFAFAFADWPALRELRRARVAPATGGGHPGFSYAPPSASAPSGPSATSHPAFSHAAQPEPAYAAQPQPAYAGQPESQPPAEPAYPQPAYALPRQPAPSAPPPPFPGYRDPNILPSG